MNELLRNVLTRRSIHNFATQQIKDAELKEILDAGKFVSGAIKNQIWHFTVIQNQQMLETIKLRSVRLLRTQGNSFFKDGFKDDDVNLLGNAPTLIIVSGDNDNTDTRDAANAVFGNMMLAAEKIGIGACWLYTLTLFFNSLSEDDLAQKLNITEGYIPLCAGVFGYKDREKEKAAPPQTDLPENCVNIIR